VTANVPKGDNPARTILVVDDDKTHRLLARDCLEAEGYRVLEAGDGEAGLRLLREERVDLVLLDVMMPGRDGYSVCQEIRSDPALAETPVMMVTGADDLDAVHRVFSVRADDFITKPVHWALLPYRVEFTLRRRDDAAALRQALAESRAASETKAQFLAAMGHELRTPLNAIIGFSDIIANNALGTNGAAKYAEYGGYILDGGKRLLTMINAILDMVKLQDKKMVLRVDVLDIESVLDSVSVKLKTLCDTAGHTFEMRCEADLPKISADPVRIGQIVENLVSNAVKFTPAGGKIEVAAQSSPGGVDIKIADNGIGMSPASIEVAMQPFRQVDGSLSRRHEGAGLGLSIAKALTELHEGTLSIASKEGQGTVVTVSLEANRAVPEPELRKAG
jgi:signal transduction histidine kinase